MPSFALPLNVSSPTPPRTTPNPKATHDQNTTPTKSNKNPAAGSSLKVGTDISSPHELTAFVETLLDKLETNFDDMSTQILDRLNEMSSRVEALEAAIQDILNNGDMATSPPGISSPILPLSPVPTSQSFNNFRRTG